MNPRSELQSSSRMASESREFRLQAFQFFSKTDELQNTNSFQDNLKTWFAPELPMDFDPWQLHIWSCKLHQFFLAFLQRLQGHKGHRGGSVLSNIYIYVLRMYIDNHVYIYILIHTYVWIYYPASKDSQVFRVWFSPSLMTEVPSPIVCEFCYLFYVRPGVQGNHKNWCCIYQWHYITRRWTHEFLARSAAWPYVWSHWGDPLNICNYKHIHVYVVIYIYIYLWVKCRYPLLEQYVATILRSHGS